jgi:outer membrane receptor protein involved in Fe transport
VQWDGLLSYRLNKKFKIQFNVKNITNQRNYIVTQDFGYISLGAPTVFYATVNADF